MPQHLATRFSDELLSLISLQDSQFSNFVTRLTDNIHYELYPEELIESIVIEQLNNELEDNSITPERFVKFLVSLYLFYTEQHYSVDEFVELVYKASISDSKFEKLPDPQIIESRLKALLEITTVLVSIKATSLASRVAGFTLLSTKHISDIRPVFINRQQEFKHAVFQQSIFFAVRDAENNIRDISISLDQEQLDKLTDDLIDAKAKKDSIIAHCKNSNIYLIADDND